MPLSAIALLGVAATLQLLFVLKFLKPELRAGWRGKLGEGLFWFGVAASVVAFAIGLNGRL